MAFIGKTAAPFPASEPQSSSATAKKKSGGVVTVLNVCAILALLTGLGVFLGAKSAVHEIEAGILALIFVCALSGSAVISELRRM